MTSIRLSRLAAYTQLRRQKLWEGFRGECEGLLQSWLQQPDPSFRNIGLMTKLLQSDVPKALLSDTSMTAQLSCLQTRLINTYRVFGDHPVKTLLLKHLRRVKP